MAVASQVSIATHTTNKHQTLQGSCKKILINERLRQKKQQQKKQETEPHWKKPSAPAYKTAVWDCLTLWAKPKSNWPRVRLSLGRQWSCKLFYWSSKRQVFGQPRKTLPHFKTFMVCKVHWQFRFKQPRNQETWLISMPACRMKKRP